MEKHWYASLEGEVLGPLSQAELLDLVKQGVLSTQTPVSTDGAAWAAIGATPQLESVQESTAEDPSSRPSFMQNVLGCLGTIVSAVGGFGFVAFVLFRSAILTYVKPEEKPASPRPDPAPAVIDLLEADDRPRPVTAEVNLQWTDATSELIVIVQNMPPEQQAALGIAALASGSDIYAARVMLHNTGSLPVTIDPANLRIHFGNESAIVYSYADSRFLRRTQLAPGQSVSGLVTFTARMDIGAAIRSGQGAMSYQDSSISVTYN